MPNLKTGISVIIPTRNSSLTLPSLLESINRQSYTKYETIVVDNNSEDNTKEIAVRMGATVYNHGPERSAQRNFGAAKARYDVLLFVDSDMELSANLLEVCVKEIESFDALCIRELIVYGKNYWAKARALERSSYFMSLYFEAARCIRRKVFVAIGGYETDLTGLEDMGLQASLIRKGLSIGWIQVPIYHHEEYLGLREYLHKRIKYGKTDGHFAANYPEYWVKTRSPLARLRCLVKFIVTEKKTGFLYLIPGLLFLRFLELSLRR